MAWLPCIVMVFLVLLNFVNSRIMRREMDAMNVSNRRFLAEFERLSRERYAEGKALVAEFERLHK